MTKTLGRLAAGLLASTLMVSAAAAADSNGPITLLVGYSAGGSADFAARVMAPEISSRLGRPVVVENATGASGMIALMKLTNSAPDTSTIYYGGFDTVVVPMANPKVKVDWEKDTIAVGRTAITSMALVVPEASPNRDIAALMNMAKDNSGQVTFGSPGIGTIQHFLCEVLSAKGGVKFVHTPYRGGAQVSNDILGGVLDTAALTLSTALPFVKDGKLRAILTTDTQRSPLMPDVPTLSELSGFDGLSLPIWQGIFVKAGTSAAFTQKLETAIRDGLADPAVKKRFEDAGFNAAPMDSKPFTDFIKTQAKTYRYIIETAAIKLE